MTQAHIELLDKTGKTVGRQPARKILKWYASSQVPPGYSVRTESGAMPIAEWVAKHQAPPELPEAEDSVKTAERPQWLPVFGVLCAFLISLGVSGFAISEAMSLRKQLTEAQGVIEKNSQLLENAVSAEQLAASSDQIAREAKLEASQVLDSAQVQMDEVVKQFAPILRDTVTTVTSHNESLQRLTDSAIKNRDRILALERRFGLAPDPNPHPKEAFKASGLPGPDLEEKDKN